MMNGWLVADSDAQALARERRDRLDLRNEQRRVPRIGRHDPGSDSDAISAGGDRPQERERVERHRHGRQPDGVDARPLGSEDDLHRRRCIGLKHGDAERDLSHCPSPSAPSIPCRKKSESLVKMTGQLARVPTHTNPTLAEDLKREENWYDQGEGQPPQRQGLEPVPLAMAALSFASDWNRFPKPGYGLWGRLPIGFRAPAGAGADTFARPFGLSHAFRSHFGELARPSGLGSLEKLMRNKS